MYVSTRLSKYIVGFFSFNQKYCHGFSLKKQSFNVYRCNVKHISSLRGKFSTLSVKDVEYFHSILPSSRIIEETEELGAYNTDWLKSHKGT